MKLLLVSVGDVGSTMSGPGIRYFHFAQELSSEFEVTLVTPNQPDVLLEGVKIVSAGTISAAELSRMLDDSDVIVAQKLPLQAMRHAARTRKPVVYDLYVPFLSEQLAMLDAEMTGPADVLFHESSMLQLRFALETGSAFVCASERQRDFWLGMLGAVGRIDLERYRDDPNLRNVIDVVPFGVASQPPTHHNQVLKGVVPGIGENDRVLLWAGGIWNWFDPLTPIRAIGRIAKNRDDVKLFFLGQRHPQVPEMATTRAAVDLADALHLLDRFVFFNNGWTPYAERESFLLEADVGVSAHYDNLETRYAFRTRLLDYFWAGLPTITTRGDVLGQLVADRDLGRVLGPEDVDAWKKAIEELVDDVAERGRIAGLLAAVREELSWARVVGPLVRLVRNAQFVPLARSRTITFAAQELWLRSRTSLRLGGPTAALRRQLPRRRGLLREA